MNATMFRVSAALAKLPFHSGATSPVRSCQCSSRFPHQGMPAAFPLLLPFPAFLRHAILVDSPVPYLFSSFATTCVLPDAEPSEAAAPALPISVPFSPGRRVKKKVAMWIGYVGTHYKGLQIQRGSGSAETIEEELECAIYKAGGIFESNFGNLAKISWSRSSRTDKGVHSLCTVISMKMEVPEAAWVTDIDGLALADSINSHLSPSIRVFGIVPVTRSFRARHDCCSRTYDYLLPAAVIGIHPETHPSEVEEIVNKFRALLHFFEGKHAYHNYTSRRLYKPYPQKPYKSRSGDRSVDDSSVSENYGEFSRVIGVRETEFLGEGNLMEELSDVLADGLADDTFANDIQCVEKVSTSSTVSLPVENASDRRAWWVPTPDESDKVWSAHFREVRSCTCGVPEKFGETQFVRISITGSSFMVHQIRKMIGTAIAVMRELLPCDVIPISLARHSRIVLPLAPPDGLILASNDFMPFRLPPYDLKKRQLEAKVPPMVGTQQKHLKLEMSSTIRDRVREFCDDILMRDILPLVSANTPTWHAWMMNLERNAKIPESEMAELRASWTEWREQSVRLRQMRNPIYKDFADLSQNGRDIGSQLVQNENT